MRVGLLDDKNWATWRYKLIIALKGLGVRDIVEGYVSRPILALNATSDQKSIYETQLENYQKGDSTALLLITTNLSVVIRTL